MAKLHNVFPEIGFDNSYSLCFESVVKIDLLAHHTLGFGDQDRRRILCVPLCSLWQVICDTQNNLDRFRRIFRTVDDDAILLILFDKLRDVLIEMLDYTGADGVGALPPLPPIGNRFEGDGASTQTAFGIVI